MQKLKQPSMEAVNEFVKLKNPNEFDFKLKSEPLQRFNNSLERELNFKRKCIKVPDPDSCELTMSIMCILLRANGQQIEGYEGRHIYTSDGNILETDTANSFISLYKGALMQNIPDYDKLCNKYDITKGFLEEYEKIYAHRDEFSLKQWDNELLEQFIRFASLTHSIGNFVLGPEGFNCKDPKSKAKVVSPRDWKRFDRMDIFLSSVANDETYPEWKSWFEKNLFSTYTDFFYDHIVFGGEKKLVDLKKSTLIDLGDENLIKRIKVINRIILSRGQKMVEDLRNAI